MLLKRDYVSRTILPLIFGGVAVAVGMLAWAQVSEPQAAQERRVAPAATQPNRAAAQPAATTTQQNQVAPAGGQPVGQNRQAMTDTRQSARPQQDSAWLGVYLSENRDNAQQGATVAQVYPSGPAARAGLYAGDVIQQINGKPVASTNDVFTAIDDFKPGDKAEITVLRNQTPTKLNATLGSRNSYIFHDQHQGRSGGGYENEGNDNDEFNNVPLYAMELEHNRRNAEQHQRIENEIAQLREEIRQLREALQRR